MQNTILTTFLLVLLCMSSCAKRPLEKEVLSVEEKVCEHPLTELTFASALQFLEKENNPTKREELARQLASMECLKAYQLIRISRLFDQEQAVIDLAVYAYPYCYDPENYFLFRRELSLMGNLVILNQLLE